VELAALPIAYGTALGMLERGSVASGQTVLVTGASGGVGLAAVQLAHARGARVVGVCSGDKGDAVLEAGADAIVDRGRGTVLADAAEAAPGGFDAVVDVVAGAALGPGLGLLRPGGRWVVAGALDGWSVEIDVRRLYLANLALVGSTMHTPRIFEQLVDLARRGEVRPAIAATFGLDEVPEAQRLLAQRRHVGKLVVVP
jgi:NADPH:quinone reductase-like Zn-dependent oxidoreductase